MKLTIEVDLSTLSIYPAQTLVAVADMFALDLSTIAEDGTDGDPACYIDAMEHTVRMIRLTLEELSKWGGGVYDVDILRGMAEEAGLLSDLAETVAESQDTINEDIARDLAHP